MKVVKLVGRCGSGYHGRIGATAGTAYGNYLFSAAYAAAIGCHQDNLHTDLHSLAEGAQNSGDEGGCFLSIEAIRVEEHGAEVNAVSLLLQFGNQFFGESLGFPKPY